jgi:hypothetical protein
MVGSYEADDSRLTERVPGPARHRPTDDPYTDVEEGTVDSVGAASEGADIDVPPPSAPVAADPEIETVTRLMGFLRNADDA